MYNSEFQNNIFSDFCPPGINYYRQNRPHESPKTLNRNPKKCVQTKEIKHLEQTHCEQTWRQHTYLYFLFLFLQIEVTSWSLGLVMMMKVKRILSILLNLDQIVWYIFMHMHCAGSFHPLEGSQSSLTSQTIWSRHQDYVTALVSIMVAEKQQQ